MMRFVMVMVGMRHWFDENDSSKDEDMILMIIVAMRKTLLMITKLTSFVAAGAFGAFAVDALARLSVLSTTALCWRWG